LLTNNPISSLIAYMISSSNILCIIKQGEHCMERKVALSVQGYSTSDGAGVRLTRVLSNQTVKEFDPFLMLDSFDSVNPDDYKAGFPLHPHRGIETISYIFLGQMVHQDSLGNKDSIKDGEVQWMTAGSGILHEEKLPSSKRMLGVQLWLNLPKKDKFTHPKYISIKSGDIEEIPFPGGFLRLLAGMYKNHHGYQSGYLPLDYYDIHLEADSELVIDASKDRTVMLFSLVGPVTISGEQIREKTAVKLTSGDKIVLKAGQTPSQVLFLSSFPLKEPVAWGGPIVMNTRSELYQAFNELDDGTFLKEKINY
jgi:hypothetical protein